MARAHAQMHTKAEELLNGGNQNATHIRRMQQQQLQQHSEEQKRSSKHTDNKRNSSPYS